jgi:hypothetical protein
MAELDQTARFALKIAPAETVRWLLPTLKPDLVFTRWLDTETIAFPGEPGRRCDTVAELVSRSGQSPPWALALEVEARPRATIVDRLLEYQSRLLRKLRHGPRRRDRYLVAGVVLFLTGRKHDLGLDMKLPGTELGMSWKAGSRCLAIRKAAVTLGRIGRGQLGRSVLPWVPLMQGAGEPAVVQEWLRLAGQEPDRERQRDYAGLALVFAERAGCLPAWKQSLERVDMWESQVIREWKNKGRDEGRLETRQDVLLRALRVRFRAEVPEDLAQQVRQTTDPEVLTRWFDAALVAQSLEAFRSVVQAGETPTNS